MVVALNSRLESNKEEKKRPDASAFSEELEVKPGGPHALDRSEKAHRGTSLIRKRPPP